MAIKKCPQLKSAAVSLTYCVICIAVTAGLSQELGSSTSESIAQTSVAISTAAPNSSPDYPVGAPERTKRKAEEEEELEGDDDDYEIIAPPGTAEEEPCHTAAVDLLETLNVTLGRSVPLHQQTNIFRDALYSTGIADILRDPSLWVTIFAPTDEAFWAYASENNMTVAELLQQPWLVPVILNHIVGFKILVQEYWGRSNLKTLAGLNMRMVVKPLTGHEQGQHPKFATVTLKATDSIAHVLDADIRTADARCKVVVNTIDSILRPKIVNYWVRGTEIIIKMLNKRGKAKYFVVVNGPWDNLDIERTPPEVRQLVDQNLRRQRSRLESGGDKVELPSQENGFRARSASMTFFKMRSSYRQQQPA